jgi:putative transposase
MIKKHFHQNNKTLSIAGSLLKSKKKTLLGKLVNSESSIQITLLWRILVLEFIGSAKVSKPFWNSQCKSVSETLWLPTETDFAVSDLNSSNMSSNSVEENLSYWMTINKDPVNRNWLKTSFPSFTSIPADKWENADTKIVTRKIKLYPTQKQRQTLKKWIGTSRYVWNKTLAHVKAQDKLESWMSLRNKFVTKKNNPEVADWETETPKHIRLASVKQLHTSYRSAWSNLANGHIDRFTIGWKKKKAKTDAIEVEKSAIKILEDGVTIYSTILQGKIRVGKRQKKELKHLRIECDSKIFMDGKELYLLVPIKIEQTENKATDKLVSLDPGCKDFFTGYDPDGTVFSVSSMKPTLDKYRRKIALMQSAGIHQMKINKYFRKMSNVIHNLHHQFSNYLTKSYNWIILPKFETQGLVKRARKGLRKSLFSLAHYSFRTLLLSKAGKYTNSKVMLTTEEYTTQTCGKCGSLKKLSMSDRVYTCKREECNYVCHRDINAARNILVKSLIV